MEMGDDEVGVLHTENRRRYQGEHRRPEKPPIVNRMTNAHRPQHRRLERRASRPTSSTTQLNTFIAGRHGDQHRREHEIQLAARLMFMPTVNMWCAHTTINDRNRDRQAIANTIA
jgi:hypothetical protein